MFYVGQKVVCVITPAPIPEVAHLCEALPQEGQIYTIRAIEEADPWYYKDETAFLLHELRNAQRSLSYGRLRTDSGEPNFHCSLFRPLTERKTNISCFKALLNPANHKEFAD
jgi:hypothetical protein